VVLDFAGPAGRSPGVVGNPTVLGSTLGIAARHLVMDTGDGLFGLHQIRGQGSQTRTGLLGALDLLAGID
jgi:hypothetical protein